MRTASSENIFERLYPRVEEDEEEDEDHIIVTKV
jgi:hypothetical protein